MWIEAVAALHEAIAVHRLSTVEYRDSGGVTSTRDLKPLCLACRSHVWTLGAWCRLRRGFRNFRPDRMQFAAAGEIFVETVQRGLDANLAQMGVPHPHTNDLRQMRGTVPAALSLQAPGGRGPCST